MFRRQRWSKPLLFRSRILLPDQLQHLPPEFSLASLGSNLFPRCGAAALWLLLRDIAATISSPAGSSTPASSLRPPASASGSARSSLVLIAVLFNRTSSGGRSVGDISNGGWRGHYQRGSTRGGRTGREAIEL